MLVAPVGCGAPDGSSFTGAVNVQTSLSVTSNEPVTSGEAGDQAPDWVVVDAHTVRLRAERLGGGTGRVYTVTVTAQDAAGGASHTAVTVTVPHDRRR